VFRFLQTTTLSSSSSSSWAALYTPTSKNAVILINLFFVSVHAAVRVRFFSFFHLVKSHASLSLSVSVYFTVLPSHAATTPPLAYFSHIRARARLFLTSLWRYYFEQLIPLRRSSKTLSIACDIFSNFFQNFTARSNAFWEEFVFGFLSEIKTRYIFNSLSLSHTHS